MSSAGFPQTHAKPTPLKDTAHGCIKHNGRDYRTTFVPDPTRRHDGSNVTTGAGTWGSSNVTVTPPASNIAADAGSFDYRNIAVKSALATALVDAATRLPRCARNDMRGQSKDLGRRRPSR